MVFDALSVLKIINMLRRKYDFYVYIMASATGTLYVGVTDNLSRRVAEHKEGRIKSFTQNMAARD